MDGPFVSSHVENRSMTFKSKVGLSVAGALVLSLSGALADDVATTATAAAPSDGAALVSKGKQLYATNCLHCHGLNMVTPGTVAFDLRQFPADDHARFVNSVTNGKNNRMPAWGDLLKPDDIEALWAYVLTGGKAQ